MRGKKCNVCLLTCVSALTVTKSALEGAGKGERERERERERENMYVCVCVEVVLKRGCAHFKEQLGDCDQDSHARNDVTLVLSHQGPALIHEL